MRNIFVSSTFQDMQGERDIIRQKVFPAINKLASRHNDYIEFSDLRWGIDTQNQSEQEASIKIMGACLNELRRTDDLMIILLGDRYGWAPDFNSIKQLQKNQDILTGIEDMSVTAFEIEHGVLSGNKKALVYFREFTDTDGSDIHGFYQEHDEKNKQRLKILKEKLRQNPNCEIRTYHIRFAEGKPCKQDLEAFAEMLTNNLQETFTKDWEIFDKLSDFDREQETQWGFLKNKAQVFYARKDVAENLLGTVESWATEEGRKNYAWRPIHFIIGQPGSGKSTMLSWVADKMSQRGWDILPFIGGLTSESSDAVSVLRNEVYYLEEQLEIEHRVEFRKNGIAGEGAESTSNSSESTDVRWLQERLLDLATNYGRNHRPLLVLIDALDLFYPDENRDDLIFCPDGLDGNIHFIITSTPSVKTGAADKIILKELNRNDQLVAVRGILHHHHKELSEKVIDTILIRNGSQNPLYLSMVIDRLMLMDQSDFFTIHKQGGRADAIASQQISIIKSLPDELSELAVDLFKTAGEKIDSHFTEKVLQCIAISRRGLREADLIRCMGDEWDALAFSQLLFYLNDQFLIHIDGRIDFIHKTLRQGVLSVVDKAGALHYKLEYCFHQCAVDDAVRADELLYHCHCRDDFIYAAAVIKPVVYRDFSKDKKVLKTVSKKYSRAMADLALPDRGVWVNKWLDSLKEKEEWDSLWTVLWFLNEYVLSELPNTKAGYETSAIITKSMKDIAENASAGSWVEKDRKSLLERIQRNYADDLTVIGDVWNAIIERKRIFESSRVKYESLEEKNYADWRRVFIDSYLWLANMKGSSDRNILIASMEPAEYAVKLLEKKSYVDRYLNDEECLIGQLYGCIGEVCRRLDNLEANLLAYEQDLRYREEVYKRSKSAVTLQYYTGSYHNISNIYYDLWCHSEADYESIYSGTPVLDINKKYRISLLPITHIAKGEEKTDGEIFMERCHKQTPIVAVLLSRNREIELLETALEMHNNAEWHRELNDYYVSSDALWYKYYIYSVMYFSQLLKKWDPKDVWPKEYFNPENTCLALRRLCKAFEYSWQRFFDDSTEQNALIIKEIICEFMQLIRFIKELEEEIISQFDKCIHNGEQFLIGCLERSENDIEKNEEFTRWIVIFVCISCANIVIDSNCLDGNDDTVRHWVNIALTYLPGCKIWLGVTEDQMEQSLQIANYECIRLRKYITVQNKAKECSETAKRVYKEEISPDGKSWYKGWWKSSLRDGYGEAKFPSGGSYKGEWRDGAPEGCGIRKYASGKIEYGVFENGKLVKPMPKGIVLLKLQKKKNDL